MPWAELQRRTETANLSCSSGITVSGGVSCELASNVFYEYYKATQQGRSAPGTMLSVWSPVSKRYYTADCTGEDGGVIVCGISGTGSQAASVQITQAALDAYTPQQASDYAAKHDLGPNG